MAGMALHTEEWLGHFQQRFIGRTVGPVAVSALFSNIGVFVNERSLVFHVATGAKGFGGDALEIVPVG